MRLSIKKTKQINISLHKEQLPESARQGLSNTEMSGCNLTFIIIFLDSSAFFYSAECHGGEGALPSWIFPLWQPDPVPSSAHALQRHRWLWKSSWWGELRWVTVSNWTLGKMFLSTFAVYQLGWCTQMTTDMCAGKNQLKFPNRPFTQNPQQVYPRTISLFWFQSTAAILAAFSVLFKAGCWPNTPVVRCRMWHCWNICFI